MNALYVFIGGGLGSLARYGIGIISTHFFTHTFPFATLISNVLACLILAITTVFFIQKGAYENWLQPLIVTGFCGGFSTFSTFGHETVQLIQLGNPILAILNILISLATGIGLIFFIYAVNK
jgi:CrcB protein